ncbi:Piwi domain-containing protein [Amylostereum chailletii]|nr:Piwi domain-containing protein [Amylostereum chailletii]
MMRQGQNPPQVIRLPTWNPERIIAAITKPPTIIVVFLPNNASELHKSIKYWGDTVVGCATQCSVLSKVKPNDLWCTNLALKMNARLGGINSVPKQNPRLASSIFGKPVIILGMCFSFGKHFTDVIDLRLTLGLDVTHPGPGIAGKPSVAGLVASHDRYATKYAGFVKIQEPRVDFVDDLGDMVYRSIKFFHKETNFLPVNLIFYRDGISEGQYDDTGLREQQAINGALQQVRAETNADVKLTYIVVEKRHHVRFFPKNSTNPGRNIDPGILIDDTITSRNGRTNFYLMSHAGILGTSRPAHYNILKRAVELDDEVYVSPLLRRSRLTCAPLVSRTCPTTCATSVRRRHAPSLFLRPFTTPTSALLPHLRRVVQLISSPLGTLQGGLELLRLQHAAERSDLDPVHGRIQPRSVEGRAETHSQQHGGEVALALVQLLAKVLQLRESGDVG